MAKKVAEIVVERILQNMKELKRLPWDCGYLSPCINYVTGRPYRGINRILLADGQEFITMNQLIDYNKRHGTNYRYISKCETDDKKTAYRRMVHMVVFYKRYVKEISEKEFNNYSQQAYYKGRLVAKDGKYYLKTFILRYYSVFNIEFCVNENGEHLPYRLNNDIQWEAVSPIDVIDSYCEREGVRIFEDTSQNPFYRAEDDAVHMIPKRMYTDESGYLSDLYHELVHSTGVSSRLARKCFEEYKLSKADRCTEEVIAEVGSMLLCAETGVKRTAESVKNSEVYVAHWMSWIENNPDALVMASFQAERAKDFILGVLQDENANIGS